MVDWYEDAKSKSEQVGAKKSAIKNSIESIYQLLWGEILQQAEALRREEEVPIYTNGSQWNQVVGVKTSRSLSSTDKREFHLKLAKDVITAKGHGMNFEFTIELGEDGVTRLAYQGVVQPTIKDVAIMLLRTLLFPELSSG
jgi:hypothetical protein